MQGDSDSMMADAANAARQLLQQPNIGGYPTQATLMESFGKGGKHRIAFDIVEPKLELSGDKIWFKNIQGHVVTLCTMDEPLISQIIFLKHFICPENFDFFVKWIQQIHARSADHQARNNLFGGCDEAELWFSQKLPVIDMANPMEGAIQTLNLARLGR